MPGALRSRLGKLAPSLTAKQRFVLLLHARNSGTPLDPEVRKTMPPEQVREFNRYAHLAYAGNAALANALLALEWHVDSLVYQAKRFALIDAAAKELEEEYPDLLAEPADREQPYFSRGDPLEKGFAEEAARWREQALAFGSQACSLRTTITRVAERYFEGSPLLLDEEQQELETLVEVWERPLGLFNDLVVGELARVAEGPQVAPLEMAELQAAGEARSTDQTAYVVDCARADALRDMGDQGAAIRLMEKYV